MNILHVDTNHPLLIEQLAALGHVNHEDIKSTKAQIQNKIVQYEGLVTRSRFSIDKSFVAILTKSFDSIGLRFLV